MKKGGVLVGTVATLQVPRDRLPDASPGLFGLRTIQVTPQKFSADCDRDTTAVRFDLSKGAGPIRSASCIQALWRRFRRPARDSPSYIPRGCSSGVNRDHYVRDRLGLETISSRCAVLLRLGTHGIVRG